MGKPIFPGKPLKTLSGKERYTYVKLKSHASVCPCGNPATRRFTGIPCCDRCFAWETNYNHVSDIVGRKPVRGIAGSEEEYKVANIGVKSNLYKELNR